MYMNVKKVENMYAPRYDMDFVNYIKDLLLRIRHDDLSTSEKELFKLKLNNIRDSDILLIVHEWRNSDMGITRADVKRFFSLFETVFGRRIEQIEKTFPKNHPVQVYLRENELLDKHIEEIHSLMERVEQNHKLLKDKHIMTNIRKQIYKFGQFINHFNRKEKLFFPRLERYGEFSLTRLMWSADDRIRNLYKGTKSMIDRIEHLDFSYIYRTFHMFKQHLQEMILQEKIFLLPVIIDIFTDDDWQAIAEESDAYGYSFFTPEAYVQHHQDTDIKREIDETLKHKQFAFGGGYLTLEEADAILNNLPVEITFVDRFGMFKYFNKMVEASEMMFIRTPSSIGRNVGNCHPPKSMRKVATLIRDLQIKRREYECMWFKKDGKYVHITYKGLFSKEGKFLGILEYVQDIQPFFELPREVKKELSPIEDNREDINNIEPLDN